MKRTGNRKEKMIAVVPTLLTLGNAACGFGAITFASKVGPSGGEGNELFIAGLLILAGVAFDALDGHAARLVRQTSNFGAELDSLCDVISFGVAPAFLTLKFLQVHRLEPFFYHPRMLWVIAALFMVCVVLRLARFNVETGEEDTHESFSGLPCPAAAGMVASVVVAMPGLQELTDPAMSETAQRVGHWLIGATAIGLPVLTLGMACLMVSRIRYPHMANQWFRGGRNFRQLVQLVFAMAALFVVHERAIPLIFGYFVLASPVRALWAKTLALTPAKPRSHGL
ncbi:MAG: CDP-diacylglycerol--serine O-phosphatidyltransferase [Planctomycetota bacterium]|jgi:CDP-diacylglycerol--serine O-phosphatidyltransferase